MHHLTGITILVLLLLTPLTVMSPASAQPVTCDDFDAWPWAQTVMESDPDAYASALDPERNGIACKHLTVHGFAPALWTDRIPADAEPAQITDITDGDTFRVGIKGAEDVVRMYHMDTPETTSFGGGPQCGGHEATNYLEWVFSLVPNGTVYLEYDETERDRFDRRLSYVWFELNGEVYMVNELMVRNGWAESRTYQPDVKYRDEINAAEEFSVDKVNGVRLLCGRFGQPVDSAAPSSQQLRQAMENQPDQGQFAGIVAREALESEQQPQPMDPAGQDGSCDPAYPDACIPPISEVGDLNCGDIEHRRFRVLQPDPHGFDGDFDGIGCER